MRVRVLTSGRTWHASCHGSLVRIDAEILTARRRWSGSSVLSFESETTTAAAAPSQLAEHIGRVFGYEIMTSFMMSSSDIFLVYAASGFSVECEWFFSLIRANSSSSLPSYGCSC